MVISKPCIHPDTSPREGYIRGQYESIEFIREVPRKQQNPRKSSSTTNLPNHARNRSSTLGKEAVLRNAAQHSPLRSEKSLPPERSAASDSKLAHNEGRARGKTISFDMSRGSEAKGEGMDVPRDEEDDESNPVEWIMITRSDPGGSVPRFMVERGTPSGIVADASKFLNWACAKDLDDFDNDDETLTGDDRDEDVKEHHHKHHHDRDLHNYQTNGHLAGLDEEQSVESESVNNGTVDETRSVSATSELASAKGGEYYGMIAGAATAAAAMVAAHTPQVIANHLPGLAQNGNLERRESASTVSSESSAGSFASALENNDSDLNVDASSVKMPSLQIQSPQDAQKDKELQKLEEKKMKLNEKLRVAREKELNKQSEDSAKEEEALRKVEEKHEREVKKAEEKHKREVEKLEEKKQKEERKAEERRRKAAEKAEKTKLLRDLEEIKAEVGVLRKEKQIMLEQIGALQAENTALAAKVGRMGLLEAKDEVGKRGRSRASSLKGLSMTTSFRTGGILEKDKENVSLAVSNGS